MNSPTCPVSSTNPVTDDIICIVGVTGGELVVGAHTVSHELGSQPLCISYHPPFSTQGLEKPRLRQCQQGDVEVAGVANLVVRRSPT